MSDQYKKKKKIYKRWWFWAIIIVIIIFACASGSSSSASSKSSNSKSSSNSSSSSDSSKLTRNNSTAKEAVLTAGTFTVGKEITPGRYVMESEGGSGNLFVYKDKLPVINCILDPTEQNGVKTYTGQLTDGEQIQISGINKVLFKPAVTKMSDTLSAGVWEVGLDIAPGRYVVSSVNDSGNFIVNQDGLPVVNEILDPTGQNGVKTVTCNLSKGEIIQISSINQVNFKKQG